MTISKHRKPPFRTAVQEQKRLTKEDNLASARRRIYDLALPEKQEYPPSLSNDISEERKRKVLAEAEERRMRRKINRARQAELNLGGK